MSKQKITAKELRAIGFPQSPVIPLALDAVAKHYKHEGREVIDAQLQKVLENPAGYLDDEIFAAVAKKLMPVPEDEMIKLTEPVDFSIYGGGNIEPGALEQMQIAAQLPVAAAGALMPDAHQGYGLPIGGVLATRNAVIPYGVGVDIGCRMCLSIYDIAPEHFEANRNQYKRDLIANSLFGAGNGFKGDAMTDHEILENELFRKNQLLKSLHEKARVQLGSSGGGNHFVEYGYLEMKQTDPQLNVPEGKYLALLTHSGSRGLGATIANHYTRLAKELCQLPGHAANLAYLDLNSEAGMEYWMAMTLAGDYASACHHVIHDKMARALGAQVLARVENHHNYAWKELWNGEEVIVHRKGATPAGEGVLGIIPGSMTAPGYLVRGKGMVASLNSASHGAGRQMSRTKASAAITRQGLKQVLREAGVELIGGGTDEAPLAYKDINMVMAAQQDLVDILAKFSPKMVRMADDGSRED